MGRASKKDVNKKGRDPLRVTALFPCSVRIRSKGRPEGCGPNPSAISAKASLKIG